MKRILVFSVFAFFSVFSNAYALYGDVAPLGNPDGEINIGDAVVVARMVAGLVPVDLKADIAPLGTPDGEINIGDAVVMARAVAGLVTLPTGSSTTSTTTTSIPASSTTSTTTTSIPASSSTTKGSSADAGFPDFVLSNNVAAACNGSLNTTVTGRKLMAIYMIGSDLESGQSSGTSDLNELVAGYKALSAADQANIDVFVAFGGANKDGWKGIKYANMEQIILDSQDGLYGNSNNYLYAAAEGTSSDMGDKATFVAFLNYINKNFPNVSSKFLTLWDHGSSYSHSAGIGSDEVSGAILTLDKISGGLKETSSCYHIIGFDACLMASLATAETVKPFARLMLASEELEPGHGWNWSQVITNYSKNNDLTVATSAMVMDFVKDESHLPSHADKIKTLSVVDLTQLNDVQKAIETFSQLAAGNVKQVDVLYQSQSDTESYGKSLKGNSKNSVDLKHLLLAYGKKYGLTTSMTDPLAVSWTNLLAAIDKFVIKVANDGGRPNTFGISIAPFNMNNPVAKGYNAAGLLGDNWLTLITQLGDRVIADNSKPSIDAVNKSARRSTIKFDNNAAYTGIDDLETNDGSAFNLMDINGPKGTSPSDGITIFTTDTNLTKVTEVYGIANNDGSFTLVGKAPAYKTDDGSYFAPQWDGVWFQLRDAVTHSTAVLPLYFESRTSNGLTTFIAEAVLTRNGTSRDAMFRIVIDEKTGTIVSHAIVPFTLRSDGSHFFSKSTLTMQTGDVLTFWTENIVNDKSTWIKMNPITITANSSLEIDDISLATLDKDAKGFVYALEVEDFAGNSSMTELFPVVH